MTFNIIIIPWVIHTYFDNIGMIQHFIGKQLIPNVVIEDNWTNCIDDYVVWIKKFCRMSLQLIKKALNITIPLKVWNKDSLDVLGPLYNRDKIFEFPIMVVEIGHKENDDIHHRKRHIVQLTKDWVNKPFYLESVPNVPTMQAFAMPKKGKWAKVIVPTYLEKSLMWRETMYKNEWEVAYFRSDRIKGKKRKRKPNRGHTLLYYMALRPSSH